MNSKSSSGTKHPGGVAQLGEHLPCKQGVKGSIPFISTKGEDKGTEAKRQRKDTKERQARS